MHQPWHRTRICTNYPSLVIFKLLVMLRIHEDDCKLNTFTTNLALSNLTTSRSSHLQKWVIQPCYHPNLTISQKSILPYLIHNLHGHNASQMKQSQALAHSKSWFSKSICGTDNYCNKYSKTGTKCCPHCGCSSSPRFSSRLSCPLDELLCILESELLLCKILQRWQW